MMGGGADDAPSGDREVELTVLLPEEPPPLTESAANAVLEFIVATYSRDRGIPDDCGGPPRADEIGRSISGALDTDSAVASEE